MNRTIKSIIMLIVLINAVTLFAQDIVPNRTSYTPSTLSYQGYLTNNVGVPINDTSAISFNIFDNQTGGNQIWSSEDLSVNVVDGHFSAVFNDMDSVFSGIQDVLFLEIIVETEILTPRQEITAVPASLSSSNWNGGIVTNGVTLQSYLNATSADFSSAIEAADGYFNGDVTVDEDLSMYDGGEFIMYYESGPNTQSPAVMFDASNNYGHVQLRDSNNDTKIELNGGNGIITCTSVQTGGLRIINSNGDVTFEIDPETGNIFYSGKLIQK